MTLTITIITGTYNRLASLKRMIESVRRALPRGIDYNFIICDGGSTDGTLEYLSTLPDVHILAHGGLKGAIKAFTEAASLSKADYTVLANDDIEFRPNSLLAALRHLETNPSCAAVAFADNRTSIVTGNGTEYRVEGMGATLHTGEQVMVLYAQVGMFRTELGHVAGWWGANDPVMSQARTYAGDNYLSSRLWEMGYTVDAVEQCVIEDHIIRDDLRNINAMIGPKDSGYYYARYPTVHIPAKQSVYPVQPRLRIMHLPVYEWTFPGKMNKERGLTEALANYGLAIELDYLNEKYDLVEVVKAWQPDLLIMQIQGVGRKMTPYILATLRNTCPSMVVVNWNGDAHEAGLTNSGVIELLRYVDLQTTINAKVLPVYEQLGINAAYWQIYFKEALEPLPDMPEYEVLFSGNCYDDRRTKLVSELRNTRHPNTRTVRLGVYGNCAFADGNTHYNFAAQSSLYQKAKIVVGDTFPNTVGFVSNRLFQVLGNGGFLLQQHSPRLDELTGLQAGVHYAEWTTNRDLKEKIVYWLSPEQDEQRQQIARQGRDFVRECYSADAQVRKLFTDLLPRIV